MPEIYFDYYLRGRLVAPEGSKLNEAETAVVLPDGREIRVWEQFELTEDEEPRNLKYHELDKLGLFFDGDTGELDGPFELPDHGQVWPPKP